MNISGTDAAAVATQQIAKNIEMMNQLNQNITDTNQGLSGKMMRVVVESKVNSPQNTSRLNVLA